jgi:intracellular sulfur oxidation DsrE/DsrF family protein
MKKGLGLVVLVVLLSGLAYVLNGMIPELQDTDVALDAENTQRQPVENLPDGNDPAPGEADTSPERMVLDISVHTVEELQVLFDRAEKLADKLSSGTQEASIVLVLHGPEVEFFSKKKYGEYKDIVDQAARLDAYAIVDVKICQAMMQVQGVERDDIPAFIEQVPLGRAEIDRLAGEGYVYF